MKSFEHAPAVLAHYECSNHKTCAVLRFLALDKDTFMIFDSFIHKVENFIRYLFSLVKQNLLLVILPIESQVLNIDTIPVIVELHTSSIHNSLNLVRNYEFEVLGSIFVAYEKSVLNFNYTDQVVFFEVLLLVHKLIIHLLLLACICYLLNLFFLIVCRGNGSLTRSIGHSDPCLQLCHFVCLYAHLFT